MDILGQPGFAVLQGLITGILTGGIYALIALGIVIINKASGVFNFAHGYMMLLGALIFWTFFRISSWRRLWRSPSAAGC